MKLKEPFVILLVGPPLSGKSTWVKNNYPDVNVVSRDEIVMEVAGTRNYNEAFNIVDHKLVDSIVEERLQEANDKKVSTIVDMTNMVEKRRTKTLRHFDDDFYKVAIVFPFLSWDEYSSRDINRNSKENKSIPIRVINRMIDGYQEPIIREGFNEIIFL